MMDRQVPTVLIKGRCNAASSPVNTFSFCLKPFHFMHKCRYFNFLYNITLGWLCSNNCSKDGFKWNFYFCKLLAWIPIFRSSWNSIISIISGSLIMYYMQKILHGNLRTNLAMSCFRINNKRYTSARKLARAKAIFLHRWCIIFNLKIKVIKLWFSVVEFWYEWRIHPYNIFQLSSS